MKNTFVPLPGAKLGGKFVRPNSPRPQPAGVQRPRTNEVTTFGVAPRATYSPTPPAEAPEKPIRFGDAPKATHSPNPPREEAPVEIVRFANDVKQPQPSVPPAPTPQKAHSGPRLPEAPRAMHIPTPPVEIKPVEVVRFPNIIREPEPAHFTPTPQTETKNTSIGGTHPGKL